MEDLEYFVRLKTYLENYFGTAMCNGNPMAVVELEEVRAAADIDTLEEIAREAGIDYNRFKS